MRQHLLQVLQRGHLAVEELAREGSRAVVHLHGVDVLASFSTVFDSMRFEQKCLSEPSGPLTYQVDLLSETPDAS